MKEENNNNFSNIDYSPNRPNNNSNQEQPAKATSSFENNNLKTNPNGLETENISKPKPRFINPIENEVPNSPKIQAPTFRPQNTNDVLKQSMPNFFNQPPVSNQPQANPQTENKPSLNPMSNIPNPTPTNNGQNIKNKIPKMASPKIPNFRKNNLLNNQASTPNLQEPTSSENEQPPTSNPNPLDKTNNDKEPQNQANPMSNLNPASMLSNKMAPSQNKGNSTSNNSGASSIIEKGVKSFISKHKIPILIGGAGIAFFVLIIFAAIGGASDEQNQFGNGNIGLAGYSYFAIENICETVKVYNPTDDTYTGELDFEKEYIPGVVNAEVGIFSKAPEVLKLFAIAARSYALNRLDSTCTIEGSSRVQSFTFDTAELAKVTSEDNPIMQAVNDTYGLVAIKNGELLTTYYDAACYRDEDENYYYIGYGRNTLGEERRQAIPKSWNNSGFLYYMGHGQCYKGHGRGISQYGAYYLATEEGYSMLDLLKYYNGDEVELRSIYQGVSSNYTLATSAGSQDIIPTSLREFLISKGTSAEALNEFILQNVVSAGIGTRDAAVVTMVSLIGGLYENYHVRLPYTLCGQRGCSDMLNSSNSNLNKPAYSFYGVDPDWGTIIHNNEHNANEYNYYYNGGWTSYTRYGPECAGFILWVLHNSGFTSPGNIGANAMGNLGTKHALNGTQVGNPGDLLWHSGHIMMIVGVDPDAKVYYIGHASGGSDGVKINTVPFTSPNNFAVDMTDWYASHKVNLTTEEFINEFRNGYVDGYTGTSGNININNPNDSGIYFVGDSRTVGLCYINNICSSTSECSNSTCLAKVGSGYSWFDAKVEEIKKASQSNIVINMGVNDLAGVTSANGINSIANRYFTKFEYLASSLPNKTIYIESVNPVGDNTSVSPSTIISFNNTINNLISKSSKSNLKFLNTYNSIDFKTKADGLHYENETYKSLYNYIKGSV